MRKPRTGTLSNMTESEKDSVISTIRNYNNIYKLLYEKAKVKDPVNGVIFCMTPILSDLINRFNLGNVPDLNHYLEYLTISVNAAKDFKVPKRPEDIKLPEINVTYLNLETSECLTELLKMIVSIEVNDGRI